MERDHRRKTEVEKTLELIGINPRDEDDSIRSPDDLAAEVMALIDRCDGLSRAYILAMLRLSRWIDEDSHYLHEI